EWQALLPRESRQRAEPRQDRLGPPDVKTTVRHDEVILAVDVPEDGSAQGRVGFYSGRGFGSKRRTPAVHPRMPGRVRQTAGDGVLTEMDGRLSVTSRAACWGRRDTTAPLLDLRALLCNQRASPSIEARAWLHVYVGQ